MENNKDKQNSRRDFLINTGLLGLGLGLPGKELFAHLEGDNLDSETAAKKACKITILQTTDVHCQLHSHDELFWENDKAVFRKTGGYDHLAAYMKKMRKKNPNTFLVDTGDMFQGSALSVKTTGKAMIPVLNALGYDLYLPGNWEVIYYKKNMQMLMGGLNAPKVCANMYHELEGGKKGEMIFHPYKIWNVGGIKIGFLGYTDPLVPIRQSPNYSKGIKYTAPEDNLAHFVDVLRNDEGCKFVVLLSHLGLSQQIALANNEACKGVDIILGGDTHERVRKPIVCKYSKVVEPGAFGSFVGRLELTVMEGEITKQEYFLDEIASQMYKSDPVVKNLLKELERPYHAEIDQIVGYSTLPLYRYFVIENTIDTMILDALRWQLPRVDIVLSNGFRFCPPNATADQTGNIPISNGYIFDMLPVDSTIRTGEVTGKQIKDWLEKELNNVFAKDAGKRFGGWVIKFEGMQITFNAYGDMGSRVQSVKIGTEELVQDKIYSIAACERDGDPADMLCRIKNVLNPNNTSFTLHNTMRDYLKNNSPVTPKPKMNAKVLDAPQNLLTQVFGVDYQFR